MNYPYLTSRGLTKSQIDDVFAHKQEWILPHIPAIGFYVDLHSYNSSLKIPLNARGLGKIVLTIDRKMATTTKTPLAAFNKVILPAASIIILYYYINMQNYFNNHITLQKCNKYCYSVFNLMFLHVMHR